MEVRVVCGLSATMATFCPTRAFSSVDFPAFGKPTSDTNPDLKCSPMCDCLRLAETNLLDAQFVAGQDLDTDAVAFYDLSGFRNAAEPFADEPPDPAGLPFS